MSINIQDANTGINSISIAFSTLFTTMLIQYLNLNNMLYGPIYSGFEQLFRMFSFDDIRNLDIASHLTIWNICIILLCIFVYKFYKYTNVYFNHLFIYGPGYVSLNIHTNSEMNVFNDYLKLFPQFYDVPKEMEYGNPDLMLRSREYKNCSDIESLSFFKKPADSIKVYFKDTNFNISGYYMWLKEPIELKKKDETNIINVPYIQLCIEDKNNADINDYFKKISKKVNELLENIIQLYHVKVIKCDDGEIVNNEFVIHNGLKMGISELENLYIKPFFHKEKEMIWKIIKEIQFNPTQFYKMGQSPRIGLLLHGPPGTGKSSFGYRIAMCLSRHIISVDLRTIKDKNEVYKIMRRPIIGDEYSQPNKVVYIFDEFDLTVLDLYAKKNKKNTICTTWINNITNNNNNKKHQYVLNKFNDTNVFTDQGDNKSEDSHNKDDTCNEVEGLNYNTTEMTLDDLLEIFQGPVPLDGSIIIATTNKFEEIKKLCPALFRPGRLTPVHFDNADNVTIIEMCKYYYNIDYVPESDISHYNLSPSLLTQIATESKFISDDNKIQFKYFIDKINFISNNPS